MRLKILLFSFLLILVLSPAGFCADSPDPDSCENELTEKWIVMMNDSKRIESYFMERKWYYLKYWETVYNSLWQAQVKKDDTLSEKRKAEGEVLFVRYDRLAEDYLSQAEEAEEKLNERIASLRELNKTVSLCCKAHDFRQCMAPRTHDISERLDNLEKILQLRKTIEVEFSARLRASVTERPSDHDEFSSRYTEYLQRLEVSGIVKILRLLRELRESLEVEWPGQKCCQMCRPVSADISQDPVLTRLRPNDQGQTGVDGRLVNNASLVKAFEEFEQSKKGKGAAVKKVESRLSPDSIPAKNNEILRSDPPEKEAARQ